MPERDEAACPECRSQGISNKASRALHGTLPPDEYDIPSRIEQQVHIIERVRPAREAALEHAARWVRDWLETYPADGSPPPPWIRAALINALEAYVDA